MTDSSNFSSTFTRAPGSVPATRAALVRFEGELPAPLMYDATLCLSELVTNAVQHPSADAGDELELSLTLTGEVLRVEVVDPGSGFRPGDPTEGDERGWGLFIVDQLASRWGSQPRAGRTMIWFEIDRPQASAEPAGAAAGTGEGTAHDEDDAARARAANAIARLKLRPAIR